MPAVLKKLMLTDGCSIVVVNVDYGTATGNDNQGMRYARQAGTFVCVVPSLRSPIT